MPQNRDVSYQYLFNENMGKALARHGTQAVNIPNDEFHNAQRYCLKKRKLKHQSNTVYLSSILLGHPNEEYLSHAFPKEPVQDIIKGA